VVEILGGGAQLKGIGYRENALEEYTGTLASLFVSYPPPSFLVMVWGAAWHHNAPIAMIFTLPQAQSDWLCNSELKS
jgi:hypothetical protein